jgi:hypothetical protein
MKQGYVIIIKLLDYILSILPIFIPRWEIQKYAGIFFRKVAYTWYDVPWFVEWMDFRLFNEANSVSVKSTAGEQREKSKEVRSEERKKRREWRRKK